MKQPSSEQLQQLRQLRTHNKVVEYLQSLERDYLDRLVNETDDVALRQIQGSAFVVRKLISIIMS